MKRIKSLAVATALAYGSFGVEAATISLSPENASAEQGGQVTFNLVENFSNQDLDPNTPDLAILAANSDFSWDPAVLTFVGFAYTTAFAVQRDPSFDAKSAGSADPWDLQTSSLLSIGWSQFNGISILTDTIIGTLTFNVVGTPGSSTTISVAESLNWSGSFDVNGTQIFPSYAGATLSVNAVPIPAAVWLLLSGLVGMFGMASRRAL
jgi:hypothetical protein